MTTPYKRVLEQMEAHAKEAARDAIADGGAAPDELAITLAALYIAGATDGLDWARKHGLKHADGLLRYVDTVLAPFDETGKRRPTH